MASHKIIRLQNDDDFIDLRAFSKSPVENFETKFLSNNLYWLNYYHFMINKYKNSNYPLSNISSWLLKIKELNAVSSIFPSIEQSAIKFLNRDIFNYSLTPQSSTLLDFTSFTPYRLDFIGTQKKDIIDFNQPGNSYNILRPKAINKQEYKVIRIIDQNLKIFIDLKTYIKQENLIALDVLKIPFFWRDYHLASRTRIVDNAHDNIDYDFNSFFFNLYNPSSDYLLKNREKNNHIQFFSDKLQTISTPIKLDFMKIANMLLFSNPGIYLPLTQRENKWSILHEPDLTIRVSTDSNDSIHLISFILSSVQSFEDSQTFLKSIQDQFSPINKEMVLNDFDNKFSDFNLSVLQSTLFFTNNSHISYCLENSLIKTFHFLSMLDNPMDKLE